MGIYNIPMKAETRETVRINLIQKMSDILGIAYDTVDRMSKGSNSFPDPLDRALSESNRVLELRERDRERKLLRKILDALARLEDGSYGICEVCEEEISEAETDCKTGDYSLHRLQGRAGRY